MSESRVVDELLGYKDEFHKKLFGKLRKAIPYENSYHDKESIREIRDYMTLVEAVEKLISYYSEPESVS